MFETKLDSLKEKTTALLERSRNFESHNDKLPEILEKFRSVTSLFESGHYKKMIVGELQKNYMQVNEMHAKLALEQHENQPLKDKIK